VAHLKEELSSRSADEVERLKAKLLDEKVKAKCMWRMNCFQAAEQESFLNEKDIEIAKLRQKLAVIDSNLFSLSGKDIMGDHSSTASSISAASVRVKSMSGPLSDSTSRWGKAPPINLLDFVLKT